MGVSICVVAESAVRCAVTYCFHILVCICVTDELGRESVFVCVCVYVCVYKCAHVQVCLGE